jgi:outer membrane protein TolC
LGKIADTLQFPMATPFQQRSLASFATLTVLVSLVSFSTVWAQRTTEPEVISVDLKIVLNLTEHQNPRIVQSQAKVREAEIENDIARKKCLSDVAFSPSFYRRLEAEGKVWLQQAELSKVTSEELVDAGATYIDLLAALTGAAIARDQTTILEALLADAHKLAKTEGAARVEVARIEAELAGRRQSEAKLQGQAAAATAKLKYLCGLNPAAVIQPRDVRLKAIDLVDAGASVAELTAQAMAQGPGVREMAGLLDLIQRAADRTHLTTLCEGDGIEDDAGFKIGCGLSELFTQRQKRRLLQAKLEEARLAGQGLQAKLAMGVDEARQTILAGREQMRQGEEQVVKARRAYELSHERLKLTVPGSSYSEVLFSLQSLGLAQTNYLNAIREHNKAQIRLFVLLDAGPLG